MVNTGDKAPGFELPASNATTIKIPSGQPTVLYFYPKDDTPGCTTEAKGFTEARREFEDLGVMVVGVSPDPVTKHDKFIAKHALDLTLVADESQFASKAFGVWVEKSMYGRTYMGIERSTFLIDADGSVVEAWRKVRVKGHVDAVLQAAREHFG